MLPNRGNLKMYDVRISYVESDGDSLVCGTFGRTNREPSAWIFPGEGREPWETCTYRGWFVDCDTLELDRYAHLVQGRKVTSTLQRIDHPTLGTWNHAQGVYCQALEREDTRELARAARDRYLAHLYLREAQDETRHSGHARCVGHCRYRVF